ncbi:SbtR family transcriptional regulator, partial [Micromonospora chersina]
AEEAAAEPDDWAAFAGFLARVVDADVHSLTVHLAGTFSPTEEMGRAAVRAKELVEGLVERAREAGRLRPDVVAQDVGLLLEACAAIRVPDPERTRQLRRRHLALLLAGLAQAEPPLPGPPPAAGEFDWRWKRRE